MPEVPLHLKNYVFKKGNQAAKGQKRFSMKRYTKEYFENMSEEERIKFLNSLNPEIVWKMAEGNPKQDTDLTTDGQPIYPALVKFINGKEQNNRDTGGIQKTV